MSFWDQLENFEYPQECYVAGGGTRSKTRMQIVSDILGIEQYKLSNAENAVGNALMVIASFDQKLFLKIQNKRKKDAQVIAHSEENCQVYRKVAENYICLLK